MRQGISKAPDGDGRGAALDRLVGIGTTARLTRLSERTLRYWETVGLVRPVRTHGGHRKYTQDQVKEIIRIKTAVKKGHLRLSDLMASREFLKDDVLGKRVRGILPPDFVEEERRPHADDARAQERMVDNFFVQQEINRRLSERLPTAVLYVDIQNLSAYSKRYGYDRGDRAVASIALLVFDTVRDRGNAGDVIGQISPDHFVAITSPEKVEPLCTELIRAFDELVPLQYDPEDRRGGFIVVADRQGQEQKHAFLRLAIGVVSNAKRNLTNYLHVKDIALELRKAAERFAKSDFVVDRRTR